MIIRQRCSPSRSTGTGGHGTAERITARQCTDANIGFNSLGVLLSSMAQEVCIVIGAEDRVRLTAIVGDRSRPLKHLQRSRVVLFSADRLPVIEVARRAGVSRPAVWRWPRRYAQAGVEGLLHGQTRPPGKSTVAPATLPQLLPLTSPQPPRPTTPRTR